MCCQHTNVSLVEQLDLEHFTQRYDYDWNKVEEEYSSGSDSDES